MRDSCKHYKEGYCYSRTLIDHLGWDWLKEQGKLEVPCTLQFEVPARTCGFRWEELTCDTCKYYEESEILTLKQLCVEILKHKFGENNVQLNSEKNCWDVVLDFNRIETTCLKESYRFYENLPMSLNGRIIRWYFEENYLPSYSESITSNIIIEAALLDSKSGKKCSVARHYVKLENENFIKAELLVDVGSITWELLINERIYLQ